MDSSVKKHTLKQLADSFHEQQAFLFMALWSTIELSLLTKATIHHVTTMQATFKNVMFLGYITTL